MTDADPLREALEYVHGFTATEWPARTDPNDYRLDILDVVIDALAAQPEPLDVERLARAMDAAAEGLTEQGVLEPNAAVLATIVAMASLGRGGPRAATCRQHGCLVNEIKQALAWRDAQRVDSV